MGADSGNHVQSITEEALPDRAQKREHPRENEGESGITAILREKNKKDCSFPVKLIERASETLRQMPQVRFPGYYC